MPAETSFIFGPIFRGNPKITDTMQQSFISCKISKNGSGRK